MAPNLYGYLDLSTGVRPSYALIVEQAVGGSVRWQLSLVTNLH